MDTVEDDIPTGSYSESRSESSSEESEEMLVQLEQPDTFEVYFEENDDHWLTEEHIFELQTAKDEADKSPPPLQCTLSNI